MNRNSNQVLDDGVLIENEEAQKFKKQMWAGKSNILVCVRVRPLMKHDRSNLGVAKVLDHKVVVVMDPAKVRGDKDVLRVKRSKEKRYAFDYVFEEQDDQLAVYENSTRFLVPGILDGFNATVFAYGCTGAGKTYTMIGTQQKPGIMVHTLRELFGQAAEAEQENSVKYKVSISFLEVYNENIRDLLTRSDEYLDLREDPIKGPTVSGITEIETKSAEQIMELLHHGNRNRTTHATKANEVSSRSHAVLQVIVEGRDRAPGTVAKMKIGKLSLVDLAGSERAAVTKNKGKRLQEGANINRSLLALGNCINALGEKNGKGQFVPYRDSKLTRLLKDSLGGNCRTVMIANISQSAANFEETNNTLKYANRAKNIKTNVHRNEMDVNHHISQYKDLIQGLRREISALKSQLSTVPPEASPKKGTIRPETAVQRQKMLEIQQSIVANFQERMQLRRSLIELEDQNVQNSIEVGKRQLIIAQWNGEHGGMRTPGQTAREKNALEGLDNEEMSEMLLGAPPEVRTAWRDVEQLRKAVDKNNTTKKSIAKRLRHNERQAEGMRKELATKITGEDRIQLMELQYRIGKLELENMELEQSKIVHDSVMKGKDLTIMKLRLQLQVRDKIIESQRAVLGTHGLDSNVSYSRLALLEQEGVAISFDTIRGAPRKGQPPHSGMGDPMNSHGSAAGRLGFGLGPSSSQSHGRQMSTAGRQLTPVMEPKASPIQYEEEDKPVDAFVAEDDTEAMRKAERQRRRRRRPKETSGFEAMNGSDNESNGSFQPPSEHPSPQPQPQHDPGPGMGIPVPRRVRKRSVLRRPPMDQGAVGNRRRNRRGHTKLVEEVSVRGHRQMSMKRLPDLKAADGQMDGLYVPELYQQPGNNAHQASEPTLGLSPDFRRSPHMRRLGGKKALGRLNQKKLIIKHNQFVPKDHSALKKNPTEPALEAGPKSDRIERGKNRLSLPDVQSPNFNEDSPG